jgi:hypothetical protein
VRHDQARLLRALCVHRWRSLACSLSNSHPLAARRNYKAAQKLIHTALIKHKKQPVLLALLALCSAYTTQPAEARGYLAQLPPLGQLDQTTFNTVTLVWRALDDVAMLIQCFETALARAPQDEENSHHLFFILTRTGDYARLQTSAMKMYTQWKKEKHLVWSCLNLLLQRDATPLPPGQPDKMLQLLEMMLHRTFQYPQFPRTMQPEELLVLWRVYGKQAKWAEALKLLDSESGRAFQEKDGVEYLRLKAATYTEQANAAKTDQEKVKALSNSNQLYSDLISQNPDDWFFLTRYLEQEFQIAELQEHIAAGSPAQPTSSIGSPVVSSTPGSPAPAGISGSTPTPPPEMLTFDERLVDLRAWLAALQAKCIPPSGASPPNAAAARRIAGATTSPSVPAGQAKQRGPFLAEVELEFLLCRRQARKKLEDAQPMWKTEGGGSPRKSPRRVTAPVTSSHAASAAATPDSAARSIAAPTPTPSTAAAITPLTETTALERAIVLYFRQFGSKTCFFNDIVSYLAYLTPQARVRMTNACMTMITALVEQVYATAASAEKALTDGVQNLEHKDGETSASPPTSAATTASTQEAASVRRFQLSLSVQQLMRYNHTAMLHHASEHSTPPTGSATHHFSALATTGAPSAASNLAASATSAGAASSSSASLGLLSPPDLESSGRALFDQFLSTTKLPSTILRVQTERGVGDGYLGLFAQGYLEYYLSQKKPQRKYLLDIITALELGLAKYSVWNYQFKLWLIRLYCHPEIGAFSRALALYRSLEIKQIQHEITSHLITEDAVRYGAIVSDLLVLGGKLMSWHGNAERENTQTVQFAYERGNYTKVIEFTEFKDRRVKSLVLYQARIMQVYGAALAFGNQANPNPVVPIVPASSAGSTSGGSDSSSSAASKKPEKDVVTIHTYLEKARADLLEKYPNITDHSTSTGALASMHANGDYTILTLSDSPSSPLHTILNRPAPGLWKSGFEVPLEEDLLRKKEDDTHTHYASKAQLLSLRFYRLVFELLWEMMEQQSNPLRAHLVSFQNVLSDMGFLDFSAPIPVQAAEALASFDEMHWRLGYLTFELSAGTVETTVLDAAFLDGFGTSQPEEEQEKLDQHVLRWSHIQRQYSILHFLVDAITAGIVERFYLPPPGMTESANEDARKVVHGLKDVEDQPINPPALRDLAMYSQFSLFWLCLAVQVWSTIVPSKKSFKKLAKKRGGGSAREITLEEETKILEPILAVRLALAGLTKAMRQSIVTLLALTKKLSARAPQTSKTGSNAASTASTASSVLATTTLLEHKPTILALQAPENQSILQGVLQHIEHSHGQAGANLYHLLHSLDGPLQAMKL